mmetsp:Transcript_2534/g.2498  ORF Transcript_2534/g.2498 Transcript_2534/m.2498 type:complete len:217 (+) Transcript_2534:22-672(+)
MSAVLPTLNHLTLEILENVYEPSDDTFLVCDCLLNEIDRIVALHPLICVEIGSGSGCIITYLGQLLNAHNVTSYLVATDINIHALQATKLTALNNNVSIDCVRSSLLHGMEGWLGKIDIMLFNPPYVPTPNEEISGCGIEVSWAGGDDGRIIIDKFLPIMQKYLSTNGICYLLLEKENKPDEIREILKEIGMKSQIIIQRRAKNEHLCVLRISHCK